MLWWPLVLSALSLLVAVLGLVRTFFAASQEQSATWQHDLGVVQERCSLLEMKMQMFWRLVEEHLSGMLKRPTHEEMDALLDKLKAHTLTLDEAYLLRTWVREVYLDEARTPPQQRIIATLVLGAVDALIHERERR
jgi:hypothetical protein